MLFHNSSLNVLNLFKAHAFDQNYITLSFGYVNDFVL